MLWPPADAPTPTYSIVQPSALVDCYLMASTSAAEAFILAMVGGGYSVGDLR